MLHQLTELQAEILEILFIKIALNAKSFFIHKNLWGVLQYVTRHKLIFKLAARKLFVSIILHQAPFFVLLSISSKQMKWQYYERWE